MRLFEFEGKEILRKYGIWTPKGRTTGNADEAGAIAREIGKPVVLKSQILISSRGKVGGIIFADDAAQARKTAADLLGSTIKGNTVSNLLVEEKLNIVEQFFVSVAIDRQARRYVVLASTSGGVDIEQLAETSPKKISRQLVEPDRGFNTPDAEKLVGGFKIGKNDASRFASIISTIYKIAMDYDAGLVEINPLAKTSSGEFIAADARIIIDDNAVFRHPEFKDRGLARAEDTPREAEARKQKFAYVDLNGDIGIVGNGAGLVMATLDLVNVFGGKPANFLDIGGGAQVETIKNAVLLVITKPEVKAILVNILGGITRCDMVAEGVVQALNESEVKKPIAVRMMGTNEEEGKEILRRAGVHSYANMEEAAEHVLKLKG